MYIYIYLHTYVYACICTRKHMRMHGTVHMLKHWYQDPQSMHKYAYIHTRTHVYKRIDVQIHTHMHIYTYIMSAHIHTYTYIHTRVQNVHMNALKARLKRRRGSDCVGSPLKKKIGSFKHRMNCVSASNVLQLLTWWCEWVLACAFVMNSAQPLSLMQ